MKRQRPLHEIQVGGRRVVSTAWQMFYLEQIALNRLLVVRCKGRGSNQIITTLRRKQ
jgi:hypothetical protein